MTYIKNQEELINVLMDPANTEVIKRLIIAYSRYYKAEENIDKFLYSPKGWMFEEGWTLEERTKIRDRKISDCIGIIFDMNRNSKGFLRMIRKDEFIFALNEIYDFITTVNVAKYLIAQ